jgi:two-component system cell cycle response regulator DivK
MDRRRAARPQRVLVVDDSPDIRELWKTWLTIWGFSVEEARNGAEALQKAVAHPPDLVLMDLWMPVMDGLTATKRLKADPRTFGVPVLALTAQSGSPNPAQMAAAGAAAFITKPCDPDVLLNRIRGALGQRSGPVTNGGEVST